MSRVDSHFGNPLTLVQSLVLRLSEQLYIFSGETARKTYVALVDQAIVSGTRFIASLMVGRICGANDLGSYSLAFTLLIVVLGAQQSLVAVPYTVFGNRLEGEDRAISGGNGVIQALLFTLLSALFLTSIGVALHLGFGPAGLEPVVWVLVGVIPFALLQDLGRRYAFAHLQMGLATFLDIIVAVMQIGGLAILAASGSLTPCSAYATLGIGSCLAGVVWLVVFRKNLLFRRGSQLAELKRNWHFGKWLFGAITSSMLNGYIMYWFVAFALDNTATGIYAACMTVLLFSNPFLMGMSNVLTPRAARAYAEGGNRELLRVVFKTTWFIGSVMTAFCVVVAIWGGKLVAVLFGGQQYQGHGDTVAVLALGFLAGALSLPAIDGLVAHGRPDINFKTSLFGLVVKIVMGAALVSYFGILGAAIGSLIGSAAMSIIRWLVFLKLVHEDQPGGVLPIGNDWPALSK